MSDITDNHTPSPEFSAALARDIASTFRRESRFAPRRSGRAGRLGTGVALAIGLIAGVAAEFASSQVADARQREEIASTTGAKRELAAVQRDLARANYEQVRRAFDKGAITQAARLSAQAELQASEARVARIELDLAESRATAAPPRDELWAPPIDGRDFVTERLIIEAGAAQRRLASVGAAAADADRAFRAGILTQSMLADAQSEVLQAKREADAVAQKLSLRKQFFDEHLAPDDVARRLQRFELMTDVERARQLLRLAEERLTVARERSRAGQAGEHKAKRAEVAALEGSMEIEQLRLNSARTALTYRATPAVQQGIPTVDLAPGVTRTTEPLGALQGVREVTGGRVLVNDAGNRQLRLFDTTLTLSAVTLDSTPGVVNRYGARVALIRYLGDSSLFPDVASQTIRVLDARGQVARTVALPSMLLDLTGIGYADTRGRVLFPGVESTIPPQQISDSTWILRFDLDAHRVDTVGRVKSRNLFTPYANAVRMRLDSSFDIKRPKLDLFTFSGRDAYSSGLVGVRDDWTVLADGTIALVRGSDYHIDWVRPNGAMGSTAPLPFDRQRLADDSARAAQTAPVGGARGGGGGRGGRGAGGVVWTNRDSSLRGAASRLALLVNRVDFALNAPAVSFGSAISDLEGNVWILPTGSTRSQSDQVVYDVVNARGQLFLRVRMPVGRSVVGFGKGGSVYLVSGDRRSGFSLERTKLGEGR